MEIFNFTTRPDESLFYKRNDINDKRLGEAVTFSMANYEKAKVILLGVPQDEGVKRNKGRIGAAKAPHEIRKALYKLAVNDKINDAFFFDIGDIKIEGELEEIHQTEELIVSKILSDGKKIIIIGGGNDISYPDCKALAEFNSDLLAFNIDSHYDVRADEIRNSGTPYRMLLEEEIIKGENFYEIGIKDFASSAVYYNYLIEQKSKILFYEDIKEESLSDLFTNILPSKDNEVIFWGFDMDVVRASDAPGVSAPSPTGLFAEDAIEIASIAANDERTKIFEISEVNPNYDLDGRTTRLAAIMIWKFLMNLK